MRMSCTAYITYYGGDGVGAGPIQSAAIWHSMQHGWMLMVNFFIYYGVCVLMSPEIRDMDNKDIQMIPVIMCGLWMRFCLQSCDSSRSVSLFKYKLASLFMRRPATVWLPEIYVSVRVFRGQLAGVSFSPKDDEHIWQKTYGFGCTVMFWLYLSSHIGRRGISKFP